MTTQACITRTALSCFLLIVASSAVSANNEGVPSFLRRRRLADNFCWKDTTDRGVGTIPSDCPAGMEQLGLLCYEPCPSGYSRSATDCIKDCPPHWTDEGLFCGLQDYGRGGGYGFDLFASIHDGKARCEHDHGANNCEENGLLWYPKCAPGYHADACCICVPDEPDCSQFGLGNRVDIANSCARPLTGGTPHIKNGCPSGKVYDAGLCYTPCESGYDGVGPVCWSQTPSGWVNCGAGDARTEEDCATAISAQVTSVIQSAVKIVTLLTGQEEAEVAEEAANTADLTTFKKLLSAFKLLLQQEPKLQKIIDEGQAGDLTTESLLKAEGLTNVADIARFTAQIAAFFDPTGVSGIVAAYSYPTCSQINE